MFSKILHCKKYINSTKFDFFYHAPISPPTATADFTSNQPYPQPAIHSARSPRHTVCHSLPLSAHSSDVNIQSTDICLAAGLITHCAASNCPLPRRNRHDPHSALSAGYVGHHAARAVRPAVASGHRAESGELQCDLCVLAQGSQYPQIRTVPSFAYHTSRP